MAEYHDRFRIALGLLVDNCLQYDRDEYVHKAYWLREFATVRCMGPRQTGSTTALFRTATTRFERPILIFGTHEVAMQFRGELHGCSSHGAQFRRTLRGYDPDCVGVDQASLMPDPSCT